MNIKNALRILKDIKNFPIAYIEEEDEYYLSEVAQDAINTVCDFVEESCD